MTARKLSSKYFFFVMVGIVVLLALLCVGGLGLGNSLLTKKTQKLTELKLENRVLDEQKIAVVQAQKDLEKYAELERIAKQVVPQDKDQAKTVREIIKFAEEAGIGITSVSFPSSTLGAAPAPAPKAADGEASTAPKATTPPITQVKPVDGVPGVYQLEITIQSSPDSVTFPKLLTFLKKLESNRRTSQVNSINITPNATNRSQLSVTMIINVYIKP